MLPLLVALACQSAPAPPPGPPPAGPLAGPVTPTAATLGMTIDPREDRFSGVVTHQLQLDAPVDGFWLHGQGLDVDTVSLRVGRDTLTGAWTEVGPTGEAWVGLPEPVGPGAAALTLRWSAPFDTRLSGLFKVEEGGQAFALAKSESVQSRRAIPGFDEPRFKVPWRIALTIPEEMRAISNAPLAQTEPAGAGLTTWSFSATPPLPTYLLSLAVGPFEVVEAPPVAPSAQRDRPIPLRGFARPGRTEDLARVLAITPALIAFFEDALGQPYPDEKLDIIAAPAWPSGATELAGAITYRETRVLLGADPAPAALRAMMSTHAHEIAHVWLGNLVTPPWWDDLWLKEGFAVWGSSVSRHALEPEAGHDLDAIERTLTAMDADALASARSVRGEIAGTSDIRNAYNAITYSKGHAVLAQLEGWLGPERVRAAVGDYVARHAEGVADSTDLYAALSDALAEPQLEAVLNSFVEQPGLPLIDVALRCEGGRAAVDLRQQPFAPVGSQRPKDATWTVPLCVGTPDGTQTCAVLDPTQARQTVALEGGAACPAWVHLNPRATSYLHFSLPPELWSALADDLPEMAVPAALMAVASAQAAFAAGRLDAADLLPVFRAAARHPDHRVATRPLRTVGTWLRRMTPASHTARARAWADATWRPRLRPFDAAGLSPDEIRLQSRLLSFFARDLEDREVRDWLVDQATREVGFERPAEPDTLLDDRLALALSVAVQDRGSAFATHLQGGLDGRDDPRLTAAAAVALGAVSDPAQVEGLLEWSTRGDLDPRDAWSVLSGLFAEDATRAPTWAWTAAHLDAVAGAIPLQWKRKVPTLLAASCDPALVSAMAERLAAPDAPELPGYARTLAETEESVALCAAGVSAHAEGVASAWEAAAAAP